MTGPEPHEHFAELAAGHALHALEPEDEQVFLAHLSSCAECQQAVDVHTETLGHLAYAAESVELPSGILDGIRSQIGQPAAPVAAPDNLKEVRRRRRLPSFDSRGVVGIAAAVALVLSLGVWNLALHRDRSQADQRAQTLAAAVKTLEVGAKQRVQLTDAHGRPVAVAVVHADDTVSMVVDGLAPNDRSSSIYVLWQKGAYGVVRAIGTFDVRGTQVNLVRDLKLAGDVVGVQGFAVTREPGRRAPAAPGSNIVADGGASA